MIKETNLHLKLTIIKPMMKSTISFCIKRKSNFVHLLTEEEFSCNFLVYRPEKRKETYLLG